MSGRCYVRGLRQSGDLTLFQNFLRTIAAGRGQLLNLTDVARGIGMAVNTAKSWLAVLEARSTFFPEQRPFGFVQCFAM